MRTFRSGPPLGLVGPLAEGAYKQGHARVNQGRSARDQIFKAGHAFKRRAPVSVLLWEVSLEKHLIAVVHTTLRELLLSFQCQLVKRLTVENAVPFLLCITVLR